MTDTASVLPAEALLERARQFDRSGQALQAESLCLRVLDQVPGYPAAALMAARFATSRRDLKRAVEVMQVCVDFEKEIGHQDAEKDADRLEAVRAKLGKT